MRVAIGSDHAGYALKERLCRELERLAHEVVDLGTHAAAPPVDYPDFIFPVAEMVARGDGGARGGARGQRHRRGDRRQQGGRVRAAVVTSDQTARLTRMHNDSNVLALGGRTNDPRIDARWLSIWLETPFEGGRHVARLRKIAEYESAHLLRR